MGQVRGGDTPGARAGRRQEGHSQRGGPERATAPRCPGSSRVRLDSGLAAEEWGRGEVLEGAPQLWGGQEPSSTQAKLRTTRNGTSVPASLRDSEAQKWSWILPGLEVGAGRGGWEEAGTWDSPSAGSHSRCHRREAYRTGCGSSRGSSGPGNTGQRGISSGPLGAAGMGSGAGKPRGCPWGAQSAWGGGQRWAGAGASGEGGAETARTPWETRDDHGAGSQRTSGSSL